MLKQGDTSVKVKQLQLAIGLNNITGYFGVETTNRIKHIQRDKNMIPTGTVSDDLFKELVHTTDIKLNQLVNILPTTIVKELYASLNLIPEITAANIAHFISQCMVESSNFTRCVEDLRYSKEGLLKSFSKYFTPTEAHIYAGNEAKIANRIYANRVGNGNEHSGDGWKYKGRGYISLTFKDNYKEFSEYVKQPAIMTSPDLVATQYPLESAIFFFTKNKLWELNAPANNHGVMIVREHVNGGTIGLSEAIKCFDKVYTAIKT